MKNKKLLVGLLCLGFAFAGTATGCSFWQSGTNSSGSSESSASASIGGSTSESSKTSESDSGSSAVKESYTVSGLSGTGYSVKPQGEYSVQNGSVKAEKGTNFSFVVELDRLYGESEIVVKANGTALMATAGVYTVEVAQNVAITVEGLIAYEKIADMPIVVTSEENAEKGGPLSEKSNGVTAEWRAGGYSLAKIDLEAYTSLVFYMRSLNDESWISFKKNNVILYGNSTEEVQNKPDTAWHKFEFRREEADGKVYYQMYVDGVKRTQNGFGAEAVDVDATMTAISEIVCDLGGQYLVSELFAVKNANYVAPTYTMYAQTPVAEEATDYVTNDPPCDESYEVNEYAYEGWGRHQLISLNLAQYKKVKFYGKTEGDYFEIVDVAKDYKDIVADTNKNEWHEILIEKENGSFRLYFDGEAQDFYFRSNLNEVMLTLHGKTYISELFVIEDEDYVAPVAEPIEVAAPTFANATAEVVAESAASFTSKSTKYTASEWAQAHFGELDLLAYSEVVFYVKSETGNWITVNFAGTDVLASQDTVWHEVKLEKKANGYVGISVDGEMKEAYGTNLAQIVMSIQKDDVVYLSEICGIADESYENVEVSLTAGTGYTYSVVNAYAAEDKVVLQKGATLSFTVELDSAYNQSTIVVKANGEVVESKDGKYTITADVATTITVENVEKNGEKQLGDYSVLDKAVFTDAGEESTEKVEPNMSEKSIKYEKGWSSTPNMTLNSFDFEQYTKVKFFVYNASAAGSWFEMKLTAGGDTIAAFDAGTTYHCIEFVCEDSGTAWAVYYDGEKKASDIADTASLAVYMNGTYYVSEAFGIVDPEYTAPAAPTYQKVANNPFGLTGEETTETIGGESYAVTTTTTAYGTHSFATVDVSQYSELYFWVKKTSAAVNSDWFEMYYGASAGVLVTNQLTDWTKVKMAKAADGTWTITVNDEVKQSGVALTNLKGDFTLKLGDNTIYATALFGIVDPDYTAPTYQKAANNPFGLTGEETTETIGGESYAVTTATTTYGTHSFATVDVSQYSELYFWVKKTSAAANSDWFEMYYGASAGVLVTNQLTDWTKVKMAKAADGTWTITVNDEVKQSGVTLTNLKDDFTLKLGDNTIYATALFGLPVTVEADS